MPASHHNRQVCFLHVIQRRLTKPFCGRVFENGAGCPKVSNLRQLSCRIPYLEAQKHVSMTASSAETARSRCKPCFVVVDQCHGPLRFAVRPLDDGSRSAVLQISGCRRRHSPSAATVRECRGKRSLGPTLQFVLPVHELRSTSRRVLTCETAGGANSPRGGAFIS